MKRNCYCRKRVVTKTAWKSSINVGRKFIGCPNWCEDENGGCNFFVWVDPFMRERSRVVIPGLLS